MIISLYSFFTLMYALKTVRYVRRTDRQGDKAARKTVLIKFVRIGLCITERMCAQEKARYQPINAAQNDILYGKSNH